VKGAAPGSAGSHEAEQNYIKPPLKRTHSAITSKPSLSRLHGLFKGVVADMRPTTRN